jgi:fructosamine-3-kinase
VRIAGVDLSDVRPVGGGDICSAVRARASDGREVFAKSLPDAPDGFFAAEARGLDLLRVPGAPPVPEVLAVDRDGLVLEWIEPGPATPRAAEALGHGLAALHQVTAASFGADADGFIGPLPLRNPRTGGWTAFYVESRLVPYLPALEPPDRRAVEAVCARLDELAGPAEAPALLHGDLWSGNVVWGANGYAWLVDAAAAHHGHRETDLAMLALFGAPRLDATLAAYDEVFPLAAGWRQRVALHQLHPLLVHARLFGGGYSARAAEAARDALAAA